MSVKLGQYYLLYFDLMGVREVLFNGIDPHDSNITPEKQIEIDVTTDMIKRFLNVMRDHIAFLTKDSDRYFDAFFRDMPTDFRDAYRSQIVKLLRNVHAGLQQGSDTTLFWVKDDGTDASLMMLGHCLMLLPAFILMALANHVVIRGGLTLGTGWEIEPNCLFGRVIQLGAQLEKAAKSPRIIVDDNFVDRCRQISKRLTESPGTSIRNNFWDRICKIDGKFEYDYLSTESKDALYQIFGDKNKLRDTLRKATEFAVQQRDYYAHITSDSAQEVMRKYESLIRYMAPRLDENEVPFDMLRRPHSSKPCDNNSDFETYNLNAPDVKNAITNDFIAHGIFENAISSIKMGLEDLSVAQDKKAERPERYVSCVRNLYAGALLLMKSFLAAKSRYRDYDLLIHGKELQLYPKPASPITKLAKTVKAHELIDAVKKFFPKGKAKFRSQLAGLQKFRNNIEHAFDFDGIDEKELKRRIRQVIELVCDFFSYPMRLEIADYFCNETISQIAEVRKYASLLLVAQEEHFDKLIWCSDEMREAARERFVCPECDYDICELSDDTIKVCGNREIDAEKAEFQCGKCDAKFTYRELREIVANNCFCDVCGATILEEELDGYFDTDTCGYHSHVFDPEIE